MSINKLRTLFTLISNIAILILMSVYFVMYALNGFSYQSIIGVTILVFYTTLSNLFLAFACLISIPYNIITLLKNKFVTPKVVTLIKYYATITTTITFLVVIVFLGPTQGYEKMFSGPNIFFHLVSPILGVVGFLSFDLYNEIKIRHIFYSLIPTLSYGVFYILMVKVAHMSDYYGFFKGNYGFTILIMLGIILINVLVALLFYFLFKKRNNIKFANKK